MTQGLFHRQLPEHPVVNRRLDNLEFRTKGGVDPVPMKIHVPYGFKGPLTLTESWPWPFPYGTGQLVFASAALGTTGSTTTIVQAYINGISVTSLSLVSGDPYQETGVAGLLVHGDFITVGVTQIGTGAKDLGGDLGFVVR